MGARSLATPQFCGRYLTIGAHALDGPRQGARVDFVTLLDISPLRAHADFAHRVSDVLGCHAGPWACSLFRAVLCLHACIIRCKLQACKHFGVTLGWPPAPARPFSWRRENDAPGVSGRVGLTGLLARARSPPFNYGPHERAFLIRVEQRGLRFVWCVCTLQSIEQRNGMRG